jgi:hypothetical protein
MLYSKSNINIPKNSKKTTFWTVLRQSWQYEICGFIIKICEFSDFTKKVCLPNSVQKSYFAEQDDDIPPYDVMNLLQGIWISPGSTPGK